MRACRGARVWVRVCTWQHLRVGLDGGWWVAWGRMGGARAQPTYTVDLDCLVVLVPSFPSLRVHAYASAWVWVRVCMWQHRHRV